jgi:hypothetical protein
MALLCAVSEVTALPLKRSLLATMLTIASPADTDIEKMRLTGDLAQNEPVTYIANFAMISRAASRCRWHYYREGKQQTLYFYKARELVDKTTYVSAMYDGMARFDSEEGERGLKDACAWVASHYDIHPPPGP